MLDDKSFAVSVRDEAARALVEHDAAKVISGVLSKYDGNKAYGATFTRLQKSIAEELPKGWAVTRRYGTLVVYHPLLLPYVRRLEIDLVETPEGKLDATSTMLHSLGHYLMGKTRSEKLNELLNSGNLPQLVHEYNRLQEEVRKARLTFGPAAELLPDQRRAMRQ